MTAIQLGVFLIWTAAAGIPATGPVIHPKASRLPFSHQGPFVTTGDGGVLCLDGRNALRSNDEGLSWTSAPVFASDNYLISNERALLRTRRGVTIAAWMNGREREAPAGWNWGAAGVDYRQFVLPTYVCRSLDDGLTWEKPLELNRPWCGCIHSMIETSSGTVVLVGQEIISAWRHATVVFVSSDEGVSWKRSNVLDIGQGSHDHAGSIEGTVVELKDGSLFQLLRTETGWLYQARSHDGGLSWAGLQPSRVRSVTCCGQMLRLADGRIALAWNHPPRHRPTSGSSREELSIAFSSDEGATWSDQTVIAANYGPGGRVSYPYLYERRPGQLWITTMQGGLRMKIALADISEAALSEYRPPVQAPPRPDGIVMLGDSTTAERPGEVAMTYTQRVAESLESVGSSWPIYNAGVGGHTTSDARRRLDRNVLAHQPRVVVIQFGINDAAVDVWKKPAATEPRVTLTEYEENLRAIIAAVRSAKARPILMTTNPVRWTPKLRILYGKPPYLPDRDDGFDEPILSGYNRLVRQLAGELAVPLVDVHEAFVARGADGLLLDGLHPNDEGHRLIAALLVPVIRQTLR